MKNAIMIDLETLDVIPSAVIVSVGICKFNSEGVGERKEWKLNVGEQLKKKRSVSWDTLKWWFGQSDEARNALTTGATTPIKKFLEEFTEFINTGPKVSEVWANPPSFDCTMLHSLARQYGGETPWGFWTERCVRTLVSSENIVRPKAASHGALQDAVDQAEMIIPYFDAF